ncbi:putative BAH domain, transcription elongation factor S-II, central domain-containing protein [Helianthus annuus]|nr:putative BAH domain, transcription elongation factor S-II, central domain-containing protein [Helianthus annuus]
MRNRRYLATSDDDDDDAAPPNNDDEMRSTQRKRKRMKIYEDDDEDEQIQEAIKQSTKTKPDNKKANEDEEKEASPPVDEEEEDEEEEPPDAKPVGEVVRVSGKGKSKLNHYKAFEFDGISYDLEDPVLLVPDPEGPNKKPYVAIIKDITETKDNSVMVTGQWFYRPEEAERKGGGNWQSNDTRELFYSFHRDEVPAESVMHKCVVHFIPAHKQIPSRKLHPGFIVQKVYDTIFKRLFKLTDKDYEDNMQHEIDLLVQKTMSRLGDLPDIKIDNDTVDPEDQLRSKRLLRRKNMNMSPLDVSRDEDVSNRSGPLSRSETPGSCNSIASEYYNILVKFDAFTNDQQRDKWLEKLLDTVRFVCNNVDGSQSNNPPINEPEDKIPKSGTGSPPIWPDDAVRAVAALEQASHESSDFQKYNQKMRQLVFNLKKNAQLARRLLKGELEPSKILSMSPIELKEGLTAEEIASREPEEDAMVQMTDARCKRCMEKKVRLVEIISGGHADRYQLECNACGNMWYASSHEASSLTIDGPSSAKTVGTAPWATAKFEDVEKKLVSPRDRAPANDALKKLPEKQKSFNKSRPEEQDNPPPPTQ